MSNRLRLDDRINASVAGRAVVSSSLFFASIAFGHSTPNALFVIPTKEEKRGIPGCPNMNPLLYTFDLNLWIFDNNGSNIQSQIKVSDSGIQNQPAQSVKILATGCVYSDE